MHELELQQLVKRYDKNLVVDKITFQVHDGEFFVLLGPSGGGKTTLLRLISGLERPDDGRILINRQDVTELPARQRNLGMVFQDYGLYPHMDVYGNIAYGLEARGVARQEIAKRVTQAAELLDLARYLHHSAIDLSGGEQQRVAIARALVKDANVYLFDEPLSNLDPKLRYQARRDILALHRLKQRPSVYVTHDQNEAFALADRIGVIAQARLQQIGTPEEILSAPANLFMARFVGSPPMNLLPGEVVYSEESYVVRVGEHVFPLTPKWKRTFHQREPQPIILGIAPSAIIPEWQFTSQDHPTMTCRALVEEIEPLISETVLTLRLDEERKIQALVADTVDPLPEEGETITIGFAHEQFCLFDPATEQALR